MTLQPTFLTLSTDRLDKFILDARKRVVYAAPSVSLPVASALINRSKAIGAGTVSVVLDVSEDVFRLGYGVVEALNILREQNVVVRHAQGLRISFVIADDKGFIFSIPPLLVDGGQRGDEHPNAVRASSDQIERLVQAVLPRPMRSSVEPDGSVSASVGQEVLDRAEQGGQVRGLHSGAAFEGGGRGGSDEATPIDGVAGRGAPTSSARAGGLGYRSILAGGRSL